MSSIRNQCSGHDHLSKSTPITLLNGLTHSSWDSISRNVKLFTSTRKKPKLTYSMTHNTSPTQIQLSSSTSERDLGLLISSNHSFISHCNKASSKANSILGLMNRTYISRSKELLKLVYRIYIPPHLENSSPAWKTFLNFIEKVQRHATKTPQNINILPYKERCRIIYFITLPSLNQDTSEATKSNNIS